MPIDRNVLVHATTMPIRVGRCSALRYAMTASRTDHNAAHAQRAKPRSPTPRRTSKKPLCSDDVKTSPLRLKKTVRLPTPKPDPRNGLAPKACHPASHIVVRPDSE